MGIRLQNIDKADGSGTGLGIIHMYDWMKPAGTSTTAVVNAQNISGVTDTTYTSGITNPDFARNLTVTLTDANSSITGMYVIVRGTRFCDGANISETFSFTGPATVTGSVPFYTVTNYQVVVTSGTAGAADTVSIGRVAAAKFGTPYKMGASTDVLYSYVADYDIDVDSAFAADAVTVDLDKQSITFTTACDGSKDFRAIIRSTYGRPTGA